MIIVVVSHQVKPGMGPDAIRRIDENGVQMARMPGYAFRYRMSPESEPLKIVTVTGWRALADFEHWNAIKKTLPEPAELSGDRLYAAATREIFRVDKSHPDRAMP